LTKYAQNIINLTYETVSSVQNVCLIIKVSTNNVT